MRQGFGVARKRTRDGLALDPGNQYVGLALRTSTEGEVAPSETVLGDKVGVAGFTEASPLGHDRTQGFSGQTADYNALRHSLLVDPRCDVHDRATVRALIDHHVRDGVACFHSGTERTCDKAVAQFAPDDAASYQLLGNVCVENAAGQIDDEDVLEAVEIGKAAHVVAVARNALFEGRIDGFGRPQIDRFVFVDEINHDPRIREHGDVRDSSLEPSLERQQLAVAPSFEVACCLLDDRVFHAIKHERRARQNWNQPEREVEDDQASSECQRSHGEVLSAMRAYAALAGEFARSAGNVRRNVPPETRIRLMLRRDSRGAALDEGVPAGLIAASACCA